jgi:hypothetical protein
MGSECSNPLHCAGAFTPLAAIIRSAVGADKRSKSLIKTGRCGP